MKYRNGRFFFSGVPESIDIEPVGEGIKIALLCKNIEFEISNLTGILHEAKINYFTCNKNLVYELKNKIDTEGIITSTNDNKTLIALKLKTTGIDDE